MRCLWLTRKFPRPVNSGELIYSDGLIRSFAGAGVDVTVIAHDNDELPVGDGSACSEFEDRQGVRWRLGTPKLPGRLASLFTRLPSDAFRLKNGGPAEILARALATERWDAVIIDHAAIGWAMSVIDQQFPTGAEKDRPLVIYVSHSHEAKVRQEIASESPGGFPRKQILKWDAGKYARLENELCARADLVTAITHSEVEAYRSNFPDQEYLCLTPGYRGNVVINNEITIDTPRRIVMTGSFEWIAKRMNLQSFLAKAALPLAVSQIELQIVGKADPAFCAEMNERFPSVSFVGRVPDVTPYLKNARMGLIVEELGGGFKLKALDYIFHRLPLAGLNRAVDGLPLSSPGDILLEEEIRPLMHAVSATIDDFPVLNQMQRESYGKCRRAFDWADRGQALATAIEELRGEISGPVRKCRPMDSTQPIPA